MYTQLLLKELDMVRAPRNLYTGQEATELELDMEKQTGSKLGKAVYCHPSYLTYMQSTS